MIYYPIQTLLKAGIRDIMIVTGGENIGDFLKLLGSGEQLGAKFTYACQEGSGGIPVALNIARDFVDNKCVVILGDNVTDVDLTPHVRDFAKGKAGARIFLKEVEDPQRFGIADIKQGKVVAVVEKPKNPPTNLAIIGIYMFDKKAFNIIPRLKPSERGELEITDVIRAYMNNDDISHAIVDGFWIDAGTFESLFEANKIISEKAKRTSQARPKKMNR
jgi:glucose-1-phosphate thymidylyltransferase